MSSETSTPITASLIHTARQPFAVDSARKTAASIRAVMMPNPMPAPASPVALVRCSCHTAAPTKESAGT